MPRKFAAAPNSNKTCDEINQYAEKLMVWRSYQTMLFTAR